MGCHARMKEEDDGILEKCKFFYSFQILNNDKDNFPHSTASFGLCETSRSKVKTTNQTLNLPPMAI